MKKNSGHISPIASYSVFDFSSCCFFID